MAVTLLNQTLDTDLTAVGDLTGAGLLARTGNGTAAVRSIAAGTGVTVTNGDGVSGNPTVSLDADLTVIAGLTPTDNGVIIGDGSAWTVETGSTLRTSLGLAIGTDVQGYSLKLASYAGGDAPSSFVLGIVDAVDAAAFRSAIGVGAGTGDVVAANNLSDLANAATARTNLGLAIGTNVQPYDADLTTWAGLTPSAYFQTLVDDADAATARATLGLSIGSQVQAYDADLTTWAGVTPGTGVATALAVAVGSAGAVVVNGGALGTPSSGTLTSATGLPISTGVSGLGTGIATALGINTGSAGAPVLVNGALGTPSSGTLTNATGLPISTGVSGLGTGVATFLATPSSANLVAAMTDEAGSGALYFTGGALGMPSSATLTNATGLPVSGITASTSTALGVGSIELGHASDTTLSRVSAGVVAIEGVEVTTNTASQTLTNKTLSSPTLSGTVAGSPGWASAQTFPTLTKVGAGAAPSDFIINGLGSGTSGGARLTLQHGGTFYAAIGTRSSIYGGAFDNKFNVYATTDLELHSDTSVLTFNGTAIPTISSTDTLSNKTLSSPTVSGTIAGGATWTGTQALNGGITQTSTYPYITMIDTDSTSGSRSAVIQINADSWLLSKNGDGGAYVSDLLKINLTTTVANFIVAPTANGVAIPTISSTDTLTNKTLSSPTLSGTVAGTPTYSSTQTFPSIVSNGSVSISYANPDTNGIAMTATTGTNAAGMKFVNTGGNYFFGADNSAGARLQGSGYSSAYAFVLNAESARDFLIGTNNVTRLKIDGSTGAAAFSSTVTIGGVAVPTISSTDTLSNKTLSSPTFTTGAILTGAAATNRDFDFSTGGLARWRFRANNNTESGANAGTDLRIQAYADDGTTLIGNAIAITRSTMAVSFGGALSSPTLSSPTLSGTVAGSATFSGANTFSAVQTFANTSVGTSAINITGNDSGTGAGSSLRGTNGGVASWTLGNHSSGYSGGAYDNEFTLYSASAVYNVIVGGSKQVISTRNATETLTNKTLSSPTLSGTVAGTPTFSGSPFKIGDGTDTVAMTGTSPQLRVQGASFSTGITVRRDGNAEVGMQSSSRGNIGTWTNHAVNLYVNAANRIEFDTSLMTFNDAYDIAVGTTTGTKIGTATTQKLGFFNKTPVVQPTAVADATDAASVITQLNALLTRMRNLGLIAT